MEEKEVSDSIFKGGWRIHRANMAKLRLRKGRNRV